jgi:flagellar biosynthesis/type III secretory pathway protein FliH
MLWALAQRQKDIEKWRKEGKEEGRKEGREEGREEAIRELLERGVDLPPEVLKDLEDRAAR